MSDITRLTVNINHETSEFLHRERAKGHKVTETIRKAVAVYKMLQEAVKDDRQIFISKPGSSKVEKEVILL